MNNVMPNPQNPNDPMYQFIDTQPASPYPNTPDSSPSHFTDLHFSPEGITASMPVVVTKAAHGMQNGQCLMATKFVHMPFAKATGMEQLNNSNFYIKGVTTDTFELCDVNTIGIDGRNFTPYIQGGQFTLVGVGLRTVNPSNFPPPGVV